MPRTAIAVYVDGEVQPLLPEIQSGWAAEWNTRYADLGTLEFLEPLNIKMLENRTGLPGALEELEPIRNPDGFFYDATNEIDVAAIEITVHSPDGSNIEKRYPLLWAARRHSANAFVATPFLKQRPGGQVNRFPYRHAVRNLNFLNEWSPQDRQHLRGYLLVKELVGGDLPLVPTNIRDLLPSWQEVGHMFCHLQVANMKAEAIQARALPHLEEWRARLSAIATLARDNATRETAPSTLLVTPRKWIQVYNARPDSGHWERGEGQFDSIDGRLMFTLDGIAFSHPDRRPESFEFWLPQMVSTHPWIAEQLENELGSKRLKNILRTIAPACSTKFADQLSDVDWEILRSPENSGMLLERDDWESGIFSIASLATANAFDRVARLGMERKGPRASAAIRAVLADPTLYYCSIRPYEDSFDEKISSALGSIRGPGLILAPRIPDRLIAPLRRYADANVTIAAAEQVTKTQLLALRQVHRAGLHHGAQSV